MLKQLVIFYFIISCAQTSAMEPTSILDVPGDTIQLIAYNLELSGMASLNAVCKQFHNFCPIDTMLCNKQTNGYYLSSKDHTNALIHYAQSGDLERFEFCINHENEVTRKNREKLLKFFDYPLKTDSLEVDTYNNQLAYKGIRNWIANKPCNDYYQTAIAAGNLIALTVLLHAHPNLAFTSDHSYGKTSLMSAVINNQQDVVKLLLKHEKRNINYQDYYGWTALHYAAGRNYTITKLLLEHGCNANKTTNLKNTPLLFTLMKCPVNMKVAELLVRYGADIMIKTLQKNQFVLNTLSKENRNLLLTARREYLKKQPPYLKRKQPEGKNMESANKRSRK